MQKLLQNGTAPSQIPSIPTKMLRMMWINLSRRQVGYGYISLALSRSQTVSIYWTAEVGIGTAGVVLEFGLVLARFKLVLVKFDPIVIDSSYCGGGASSSLA